MAKQRSCELKCQPRGKPTRREPELVHPTEALQLRCLLVCLTLACPKWTSSSSSIYSPTSSTTFTTTLPPLFPSVHALLPPAELIPEEALQITHETPRPVSNTQTPLYWLLLWHKSFHNANMCSYISVLTRLWDLRHHRALDSNLKAEHMLDT